MTQSGSSPAVGAPSPHLELQVDDPPRWHVDYLRGKDLSARTSAFRLNHRDLPDGADIKLIWELSRWHPLFRLAVPAANFAPSVRSRPPVRNQRRGWGLTQVPPHSRLLAIRGRMSVAARHVS
jgi:hypothetical protein